MTYLAPERDALPLPTLADAIRASDTYREGSRDRQEHIDSQLPRLHRIFSNLRALRGRLHGPTLDVASGWGYLYPALKRHLPALLPYRIAEMWAWETVIDGDRIEGCKFECDRDVLAFGDRTFGLVTFFDCLEHLLVDPMWTLLECNRVLELGGHLALSTPNAAAASRIVKILHGENPATESECKPSSIYQRHNREWTLAEVKQALQCCGFSDFHGSTNAHCLSDGEVALLEVLRRSGHVKKPLAYYGPELFVVATKTAHVTLSSDLPKDQRWPVWLYTAHDAYRRRPKEFPIVVSDDYA